MDEAKLEDKLKELVKEFGELANPSIKNWLLSPNKHKTTVSDFKKVSIICRNRWITCGYALNINSST